MVLDREDRVPDENDCGHDFYDPQKTLSKEVVGAKSCRESHTKVTEGPGRLETANGRRRRWIHEQDLQFQRILP